MHFQERQKLNNSTKVVVLLIKYRFITGVDSFSVQRDSTIDRLLTLVQRNSFSYILVLFDYETLAG